MSQLPSAMIQVDAHAATGRYKLEEKEIMCSQ